MAVTEVKITLTWENQNFFQMTSKKDANPVISIIKVEENGIISQLWENVSAICNTEFARWISTAGEQMKS